MPKIVAEVSAEVSSKVSSEVSAESNKIKHIITVLYEMYDFHTIAWLICFSFHGVSRGTRSAHKGRGRRGNRRFPYT